jgi:hypothetical protein
MELNTEQQVFLVFYAIFWGTVGSAQPRWKAFQWPLVGKVPQVTSRVWLSFIVLTVAPIAFFGYTMVLLSLGGHQECRGPIEAVVNLILHGVIPAFAIYGFYRLWIGLVERKADRYYASDISKLDEAYWHTEPTYRSRWDDNGIPGTMASRIRNLRDVDLPRVDLTRSASKANLMIGGLYVGVAALAPWFQFHCPVCRIWHSCV